MDSLVIHPVSVVIVEDNTLFCECLETQLRADERLLWKGTGHSLNEGVRICDEVHPEIVVTDILFSDGDAWDLVDYLKRYQPSPRMLVMAGILDEATLGFAATAQIHGLLCKRGASREELSTAIGHVIAGQRYFSPSVARGLAELRNDPEAWTKILGNREQELLILFTKGLSDEEIAQAVGGQVEAVKKARQRICRKLGLESTPELMRWGTEKGFNRYSWKPAPSLFGSLS